MVGQSWLAFTPGNLSFKRISGIEFCKLPLPYREEIIYLAG